MGEIIIFDLGANRGQNLNYYLSHADKVVAVEANPDLVADINRQFQQQIEDGKLIVLNRCLSVEDSEQTMVDFHINKFDSGLSRFSPPSYHPEDFVVIKIEAISYRQLIGQYGEPWFVKIDLEGYDKILLDYLIVHKLLPPYISTENCGLPMLKKLIATNTYSTFNIVSFYNFTDYYKKTTDKTAGPFGKDIKSPWLSANDLVELYKKMPGAWFDIHATNNRFPTGSIDFSFYRKKFKLSLFIKRITPHFIKAQLKNLLGYSR